MKTTVEYIVYNIDGDEKYITQDKHYALYRLKQIEGGYIRKRITTVQELAPIDEDYTVWL